MTRLRAWSTFWFSVAAVIFGLLIVPSLEAKQQKAPSHEAVSSIDLNTSTQQELENLPGVGEATAKKIIAGRPYASIADLSKAGVPAATVKKISPLVHVSPSAVSAPPPVHTAKPEAQTNTKERARDKAESAVPSGTKVDLNTATQQELEALPGVGPATAKKIMAARPYTSVKDLSKAGVPAKTMKEIASLVVVGAMAPSSTTSPTLPAPVQTQTPTITKHEPPMGAPAVAPPAAGMVWVNSESKVFHRAGDRWYGKTKLGEYMTEAQALKAGYREAK